MKVFKATRADMACTMGKGTFQYELGKTYTAEGCRCGRTGLHTCEYVLGCMGYYPLDGKNRFFLAEASGDIHEIGGDDTRVSSTKLRLLKELSIMEICYEALSYMIHHPKREWEVHGTNLSAEKDIVRGGGRGFLGIARGSEPVIQGKLGAVLGMAQEQDGEIVNARIIYIDGERYLPDTQYQLTKEGLLVRREVLEE